MADEGAFFGGHAAHAQAVEFIFAGFLGGRVIVEEFGGAIEGGDDEFPAAFALHELGMVRDDHLNVLAAGGADKRRRLRIGFHIERLWRGEGCGKRQARLNSFEFRVSSFKRKTANLELET